MVCMSISVCSQQKISVISNQIYFSGVDMGDYKITQTQNWSYKLKRYAMN